MSINYPVEKIEGKSIPWIKRPPEDDGREFIWYTITWEDVNEYPTRVLHNIARKLYRNANLWHLIYEVNPPIPPEDYVEGMRIKVPVTTAFREARAVQSVRQLS